MCAAIQCRPPCSGHQTTSTCWPPSDAGRPAAHTRGWLYRSRPALNSTIDARCRAHPASPRSLAARPPAGLNPMTGSPSATASTPNAPTRTKPGPLRGAGRPAGRPPPTPPPPGPGAGGADSLRARPHLAPPQWLRPRRSDTRGTPSPCGPGCPAAAAPPSSRRHHPNVRLESS